MSLNVHSRTKCAPFVAAVAVNSPSLAKIPTRRLFEEEDREGGREGREGERGGREREMEREGGRAYSGRSGFNYLPINSSKASV